MPRTRAKRTYYRQGYRPRRRKKINWRRIGLFFLTIVTLTAIALAIYFILHNPKLAVKKIKVVGAEGDLERRLKLAVAPIAINRNIFLIRKDKIVSLASSELEIKSAQVRRDFPRTIVLSVKLRKPFATVTTQNGTVFIDEQGIAFKKCFNPETCGLPWIVVGGGELRLGQKCSGLVKEAVECVAKAQDFGVNIHKMSVDPAGELCLNVLSNFQVKLGAAEYLDQKLVVLEKLLDGYPDLFNRAEYVDISCPKAPAVKWK